MATPKYADQTQATGSTGGGILPWSEPFLDQPIPSLPVNGDTIQPGTLPINESDTGGGTGELQPYTLPNQYGPSTGTRPRPPLTPSQIGYVPPGFDPRTVVPGPRGGFHVPDGVGRKGFVPPPFRIHNGYDQPTHAGGNIQPYEGELPFGYDPGGGPRPYNPYIPGGGQGMQPGTTSSQLYGQMNNLPQYAQPYMNDFNNRQANAYGKGGGQQQQNQFNLNNPGFTGMAGHDGLNYMRNTNIQPPGNAYGKGGGMGQPSYGGGYGGMNQGYGNAYSGSPFGNSYGKGGGQNSYGGSQPSYQQPGGGYQSGGYGGKGGGFNSAPSYGNSYGSGSGKGGYG